MPHDFELLEPLKNYPHISQNVPIKTAEFIGEQIKEYLNGNLDSSNSYFVKQDNIAQKIDYPNAKISDIKIDEW